jgi:hypothetical protein
MWAASGHHFTLDRLSRSVNTALTGEAKFSLHLPASRPHLSLGRHHFAPRTSLESCLAPKYMRVSGSEDWIF